MNVIYTLTTLGHTFEWQILLSGLSFFSSVAVAHFFMRTVFHDRLGRAFVLFKTFSVVWALLGLLSYLFQTSQHTYFALYCVAVVPFLSASLVHFALTFYEDTRKIPPLYAFFFVRLGFFGGAALLAVLFAVDAVDVVNQTGAMLPMVLASLGWYSFALGGFFALSAFVFFYFFSRFFLDESDKVRFQAKWILLSFLSALAVGAGYYLLSEWRTGESVSVWFSFFLSDILFTLGAAYAFRKRHAFNKKLVRIRSFIFLIWALIFTRLLFELNPDDFVFSAVVLLSTIILGMLFMQTAEKEVFQKEELARLNNKLQNFNANLEWDITERTREIQKQKEHTDAIINALSVGLVEYTDDFEIIRLNLRAEELLGLAPKEAKGLKFQPANSETFEKKFQSLKEVLFSDFSSESGETKKFPVQEHQKLSSLHRVKNIVINVPVIRVLEVVSIPLEKPSSQKKQRYIKLLRDVTGENMSVGNQARFSGRLS